MEYHLKVSDQELGAILAGLELWAYQESIRPMEKLCLASRMGDITPLNKEEIMDLQARLVIEADEALKEK